MKLTVKDHGGIQGSTDSIVYVVQNGISKDPLSAIFSYYNFSQKKLNSLTRGNDNDGTIVSWFWDFGDGGYSTEQNSEHRYVKFGNYTVRLTVTDIGGASHSLSQKLAVSH